MGQIKNDHVALYDFRQMSRKQYKTDRQMSRKQYKTDLRKQLTYLCLWTNILVTLSELVLTILNSGQDLKIFVTYLIKVGSDYSI